MDEKNQDVTMRVYATLLSLRNNIDKLNYSVPEVYVHEYHSVLDRLRDIRMEVSEFRIPEEIVKPIVTSVNTLEGRRSYSE